MKEQKPCLEQAGYPQRSYFPFQVPTVPKFNIRSTPQYSTFHQKLNHKQENQPKHNHPLYPEKIMNKNIMWRERRATPAIIGTCLQQKAKPRFLGKTVLKRCRHMPDPGPRKHPASLDLSSFDEQGSAVHDENGRQGPRCCQRS